MPRKAAEPADTSKGEQWMWKQRAKRRDLLAALSSSRPFQFIQTPLAVSAASASFRDFRVRPQLRSGVDEPPGCLERLGDSDSFDHGCIQGPSMVRASLRTWSYLASKPLRNWERTRMPRNDAEIAEMAKPMDVGNSDLSDTVLQAADFAVEDALMATSLASVASSLFNSFKRR